MTEAMPFLQKTILLSYDPRPLPRVCFCTQYFERGAVRRNTPLLCKTSQKIYQKNRIFLLQFS